MSEIVSFRKFVTQMQRRHRSLEKMDEKQRQQTVQKIVAMPLTQLQPALRSIEKDVMASALAKALAETDSLPDGPFKSEMRRLMKLFAAISEARMEAQAQRAEVSRLAKMSLPAWTASTNLIHERQSIIERRLADARRLDKAASDAGREFQRGMSKLMEAG